MAKNDILYIPKSYTSFAATILPADTTSLKTLYTFPSDDCNVLMLSAVTDDTAANDLIFYINTNSTDYRIGHVDLPATSGTDGTTNAVNCLNATNLPFLLYDDTGLNKYIPGKAGDVLKVAAKATVTSAKTIWLYGITGSYTA